MLKIYTVRYYVSIDTGPWERLHAIHTCMREDTTVLPEQILINKLPFNECYEMLKTDHVRGMHLSETNFKHKPLVCIAYAGDWDATAYKYFDTLSYKTTYEEDTYITLSEIMKRFPSDQVIQYLKERGLNTCPMLKE